MNLERHSNHKFKVVEGEADGFEASSGFIDFPGADAQGAIGVGDFKVAFVDSPGEDDGSGFDAG